MRTLASLALAIDRRAYLVTGDQDLLVLSDDLPILTLVPPAYRILRTEAHTARYLTPAVPGGGS